MNRQITREKPHSLWLLVLGGLGGGFLNGLLGAGGGILLMWIFARMRSDTTPASIRDTFATVVACVLPMTAVSALLYAQRGSLDTRTLWPMLFPALAGGAVGAWLLDRIHTGFLKKLFAALVLVAGIRMVIG